MTIMILAALLCVMHSYLMLCLTEKVLVTRRVSRFAFLLLGVLNAAVLIGAAQWTGRLSFEVYLAFTLVLILEVHLCFHAHFYAKLLCVFAVSVHLMALRAIVTSVYALALDLPSSAFGSTEMIVQIVFLMMLLLSLCTAVVLRLIPSHVYRKVTEHSDQLGLLVLLFAVFTVYMLLNSGVYNGVPIDEFYQVHQIAVSLTMLSGLYLGLFFLAKLNTLAAYKQKSESLAREVIEGKRYKEMALGDALAVYELHCRDEKVYRHEGERREEMTEVDALFAELLHNFGVRDMAAQLEKLYFQGQEDHTLEYLTETAAGGWLRATIRCVKESEDEEIIAFITIYDIDHEKKQTLDLQHRAERDPLTGAYNKGMVRHLVENSLEAGEVAALYILDVDDFKLVNDRMGHAYGDVVLAEIVNTANRIFREGDVVGRVGGDEFIVYMRQVDDESVVRQKAERLCAELKQSESMAGTASCSVGVAIAPLHGTRFDELYKRADLALYVAKGRGKNTYDLYNEQSMAAVR